MGIRNRIKINKVIFLFAFFLLSTAFAFGGLRKDVQIDILKARVLRAKKSGQYAKALDGISKLTKLGAAIKGNMLLAKGVALFHIGRKKEAAKAIEHYINSAKRGSAGYNEALELMLQLEESGPEPTAAITATSEPSPNLGSTSNISVEFDNIWKSYRGKCTELLASQAQKLEEMLPFLELHNSILEDYETISQMGAQLGQVKVISKASKMLEQVKSKANETYESFQTRYKSRPMLTYTNCLGMKMVWIRPGSFRMGVKRSFLDTCSPLHEVRFQKGFWISATEVTQAQWKRLIGTNPSHFVGEKLPVEQVTHSACLTFCKKLSDLEGNSYTLPSEAEWEYVCRAGTTTNRYNKIRKVSWYRANSQNRTHEVGQLLPNAWGIYDMLGNVAEWCLDSRHLTYKFAPSDGSAWMQDGMPGERSARPPSWAVDGFRVHAHARDGHPEEYISADLGFRVVSHGPIRKQIKRKKKRLMDRVGKKLVNKVGYEMVWIAPGEFQMGTDEVVLYRELHPSTLEEFHAEQMKTNKHYRKMARRQTEAEKFNFYKMVQEQDLLMEAKSKHQVKITKGYWIGTCEVSQKIYQKVMGKNPSQFKGPNRPVDKVTYEDCIEFCRRLSRLENKRYRLPTEAEWAFAANGSGGYGDTINITDIGWFEANSNKQTHDVGKLKPNANGLYDTLGNVKEYCLDFMGRHTPGKKIDPHYRQSDSREHPTVRGASWKDKIFSLAHAKYIRARGALNAKQLKKRYCLSSFFKRDQGTVGFRVVLEE